MERGLVNDDVHGLLWVREACHVSETMPVTQMLDPRLNGIKIETGLSEVASAGAAASRVELTGKKAQ